METTRRSFLKILPISGLAFAVNPVKAIESLYKQAVVPIGAPVVAATGNMLLSSTIITQEALKALHNNLVMSSFVHNEYRSESDSIINTITIRKPNRFALS